MHLGRFMHFSQKVVGVTLHFESENALAEIEVSFIK